MYYSQKFHTQVIALAGQNNLYLGIIIAPFIVASFWLFGDINAIWNRPWGFWAAIYHVKTYIEVIASGYALFYLMVALQYQRPTQALWAERSSQSSSQVCIAYLCCDDLDREALESIVANSAGNCTRLLIHDDSSTPVSRSEVEKAVKYFWKKYGQDIHVIRRMDRSGGKPGAINNIVQHLHSDERYLLLCDSDSFFYNTDFFFKALPYFDDPNVALVQFKNVGHVSVPHSSGYKILSSSVTFYDAFVSFMDRFGWSPFLGHNAILRVSVMKEMGGFTPGQLADDIDFSVKLRLGGYQIRYAREVICGERHPHTYSALRRRTRKWAYGCTQILLGWSWLVFTSPQLRASEKITFFLTVSYYHFQILLMLLRVPSSSRLLRH